MSSTSYSRNKYRCLLRSNHNVIVTNDNITEPKPGPQPRIYGYPGYGYPGYRYGYPGYGYSYPSYGYPDYGYVYPGYGYSSPGVYPGTRPYPYVVNDKKPRAKSTPNQKNEMSCEYYSSSSSSDDECYDYDPDRYYRRHATQDGKVSPQRVFDEQNQKPFPIPKPTPNPPIHRPPRPRPPPPPPILAIEEIKNKKQFVKPFAKLLAKLTTPIDPNDPNESKENEVSLGDSNLLEFKNEIESASIDPSMCNMNETKIYLKV